ncbi:MAG: ParB N-terminal domain-containing protein [Kofleriaceae bacterium]|nr:ParB N-terminal domain-containing protein [Kofleriaceae bacterium]MBP9203917.1 ParB N-terminal domain-containing protein [Kofleriaceae bacterium]
MAQAKKATTKSSKPATPRAPRKKKAEPGSAGITALECGQGVVPPGVVALGARLASRGGVALASYREPLGGHWVVLASVPIERVEPTPYQRELSKTHADRLAEVIPKVGRFLDPIIAVERGDGYITPNGMHRLGAMRSLGARAITALIVPEAEVAFRILALNTEKAHNLKDKALEAIRMAHALAAEPLAAGGREVDYAFELEQPAYLTLGICYEQNGRFSGGAYLPVVKACDSFADEPLGKSLARRAAHATLLLELDEAVAAAVGRLKEAGWNSGYLKPIVVARINPLRFVKTKPGEARPDLDKTLAKMLAGAKAFDPTKVKAEDIALAAAVGAGDE